MISYLITFIDEETGCLDCPIIQNWEKMTLALSQTWFVHTRGVSAYLTEGPDLNKNVMVVTRI